VSFKTGRAKTAEQIETLISKKMQKGDTANAPDFASGGPEPETPVQYARGHHPNSHTNVGGRNKQDENLRPTKWVKGQSGNPRGNPAGGPSDLARQIARAIFENNQEKIYQQFGKALLKGNAYAFQVLADRAYGKLKETHAVEVTRYTEASDATVNDRIAELEAKLGIRSTPTLVGRVSQLESGALEASIPKTP
jgi:hypothetical protein